MAEYGVNDIASLGRILGTIASGVPRYKVGGVTIDWTTVTPVTQDTTLPNEGHVVKNGQSYIRYGTVLCRIGTGQVQTVTISGAPTGGTFTLTLVSAKDATITGTTSALAYNATLAQVEAALEALTGFNFTPGSIGVTGTAGTSYAVTFPTETGNLPVMTAAGAFTGGTSPSASVAITTATSANSGMYGPYSSGATDGRQTLKRGECFILDRTVIKEQDLYSNHPGQVYDGGSGATYYNRVADLASNPTKSQLEAAFPAVTWLI